MTRRPFLLLVALAMSAAFAGIPARAAGPVPDCRPIAVPAAGGIPAGSSTCDGVRPGALVSTPLGICTLNFLFRGSDGRRYIGTAGHCVLDGGLTGENRGERTWRAGHGPVARDVTGRRIGEFAYAILQNPKDFALIRVDTRVASSPQLCFFGGPTGMNGGRTGMSVLHYFGEGTGIGAILPARSAVAAIIESANHVYAWGVVIPGDSGAPLISDDGRALGVVVTTGVHLGDNITDTGSMGATRITPQIARAAYKLRVAMTLLTAKKL